MPVGTAVVDWQGRVPMLLKADGSAYAGMTYVRDLPPGYQRRFPEITMYADNRQGFALMGNAQGYIDSFTIECWSWGAVQGIKNDIANPENQGAFILDIPAKNLNPAVRLTVRFFEAQFTPTYPQRDGYPQVFQASVENIEVLG